MLKNIIWIDKTYDAPINKLYLKSFQTYPVSKLKLFKNNDDAFTYLKSLNFEDVYVIISGSLYIEFVETFKVNINDMNIAPKIIVFTRDREGFLKLNPEFYSPKNKFYSYGGVAIYFQEIKEILEKDSQKNETKTISGPVNYILNESEVQLTFEYIDSKEKLYLPLYFKSLIDDVKIDDIDQFTKSLYDIYSGKSHILKELFGPIRLIPNIPIEIISKYYIRAYTSTSKFHTNVNKYLGQNKIENYITMIKTLYAGVKLSSLPLANTKILYRGASISNDEIKKIRSYKNKDVNLPNSIVFCRSFLSFSKKRSVAEYFLEQLKTNNKISKVLYILEKDDKLDYILATHADIQKISLVPSEEEVLFFPFSSFGIKEIVKKDENFYEIHLLYLGKYLKYIESDEKLIIDDKIISESEFKKQFAESNLVKKEKIQNINIKTLYNTFKIYANEININKMNKTQNFKKIIFKPLIDEAIETNFRENIERDKESQELLTKSYSNVIVNNNYIFGKILIEDKEKDEYINIINTYENVTRNDPSKIEKDEFDYKNEDEIISNIVIKINGEKIDFKYKHQFKKAGIYNIEYYFRKNLTKTDYMFSDCSCLINIDLSNFNTENITNICGMFYNCESLNNITGISNWETKNVTNMSYLFYNCKKLKNIPDISKWDLKNVNSLSHMFSFCELLNNIPDISNWNTKKVSNMSEIFSYCESLKSIPDISKWDTINVTDMSGIFYYCKSLEKIPDISKWNTKNVINMSLMFSNCESLKSIPDISNWDTRNVTKMSYMFYKCKKLNKEPDISKWDLTNVIEKSYIFSEDTEDILE